MPVPSRGKGNGHICRRGGTTENPEIWLPPQELQRIDVPVHEGAPYTLFFPIELTNKDYLRRIFDTVALYVQGKVLRMMVKYRDAIGPIGSKQEQYDFTKTCDLFYLMTHIADPASAPIYAREFKAHQERLVAACNTLKACTHLLTNLGVESGSLDSVSSSLEAARQLLSFFPAPPSCSYAANDPLALLASLEAQFDQHKAFKNSRMAALGWQFGPSATARVVSTPPLDPEAALATGRVATAAITAILDDPQGSIAAVALGILCSAVAACDKRVEDEKKRRQYHEAQTLQELSAALQSIIAADDNPHRWHEAVTQAKTSLIAMSSAEKLAAATNNFSLAAQLQFQHREVSALLNRMSEMAACIRTFSLESIDKVLLDGREHAIACLIASSRNAALTRATKNATEIAACTRSFSLESINKVLLDGREHAIACLILSSRNASLIRAMLLVAHPDLKFPAYEGKPPQSLMNQLLLSAFTCMHENQADWIQAVLHAGFNVAALKAAGIQLEQLKCAGFTAQQLKKAGDGLKSLITARYTASELKNAGITAAHCLEIGCSSMQLKYLKFTAEELKAAGYDVPSLVAAGYSAAELKDAGIAASHCKTAGCTAQQLKVAQFTATELKAAGFDAPLLVAAGYSATELKYAGFTATQCKTAGCTAQQLKVAPFTAVELKAAGFSAQQMKDGQFTLAELKAAGYDLLALVAANFDPISLVHAGFSQAELTAAGVFAAATARLAGKADIFKASENGYTAVVADHLIVDPACVRNRDPSHLNYTPLHYTCANGHADACNLLLKCGAYIEATDFQNGNTPLRRAIECNNATVIAFLRSRGAPM